MAPDASRTGNVVAAATITGILAILAFLLYGRVDYLSLTSVRVEVRTDTSNSVTEAKPSDDLGSTCNCTAEFTKWVAEGKGSGSRYEVEGRDKKADEAAEWEEIDRAVEKAVDTTPRAQQGEKGENVSVCTTTSSEGGGWFGHCEPPPKDGGPERLDAYVKHRMSRYEGACSGEAFQFHCLEYAARMGWCDWSKQPSPKPPARFLNPDKCKAIQERPAVRSESNDASGHFDDHKIVFFYPSYAYPHMLKRSISSLLHPNHIFLIQIDEKPHSNATFVEEMVEWANTQESVCVTEYGRVLYTTGSQALIVLPALAWADQIEGWTHFYLMGAQTYPIVPLEELREFSWEERNNIAFTWTPLRPDDDRRLSECLPNCYGYTWINHNWGERLEALGTWIDDSGVQHPANPKSQKGGRIDWLEKRLGRPWNMMKIGGMNVVIPNDVAKFLLHDPKGKMWIQYFTYTTIACEVLLSSVLSFYFKDRLSQTSTCYMDWEKDSIENKHLNLSDWNNMAGMGLFARKFKMPASLHMLDRIDKVLRTRDLTLPRPWHHWSDIELRRRALTVGTDKGPAKIAFLFLLAREKVQFSQLWNRFFQGHEGKFNIYVHTIPGSRLKGDVGVFGGREVPSKGWTSGTVQRAAAIRRLLANALVDDGANQRFVLISDGVIPVRSFDYLQKLTIIDNPDKSFQQSSLNSKKMWRYNMDLKPVLKKDQFAFGSPHFGLARRHARMVVEDTKIWNAFFQCGSDPSDTFARVCRQEDHYFPTLLSLRDSNGLVKKPLVTEDSGLQRSMGDIPKALMKIRSKGDHACFFANANPKLEQKFLSLQSDVLQF